MSDSPKRAVVVAAGRGKRLAPYTDTMPKCLVPIGDRSILGHQCVAYRAAGVEELAVIVGYLGDVLAERARDLYDSVQVVRNAEWKHNNILESLFCAEPVLRGPLLISYGDIYFTPEVAQRASASDADIALVIDRDFRLIYEGRDQHPLSEAEVAAVDGSGRVETVGKRSLPPEEAWGEFIGLMKTSAKGTAMLRERWTSLQSRYAADPNEAFQRAATFRQAYLTDLLQDLIDDGARVEAVEIRGQWREIDTGQDLTRARALLSSEAG